MFSKLFFILFFINIIIYQLLKVLKQLKHIGEITGQVRSNVSEQAYVVQLEMFHCKAIVIEHVFYKKINPIETYSVFQHEKNFIDYAG